MITQRMARYYTRYNTLSVFRYTTVDRDGGEHHTFDVIKSSGHSVVSRLSYQPTEEEVVSYVEAEEEERALEEKNAWRCVSYALEQKKLPKSDCDKLAKFFMDVREDNRLHQRPDVFYFAERLFFLYKRLPKNAEKAAVRIQECFEKYILSDYETAEQKDIVQGYFAEHFLARRN